VLSFVFYFLGFDLTNILLVLTTIVSLEAIYLSILIQLSVNLQTKKLESIQEDVEDIQEDVEEINEDDDEDVDIKTINDKMNEVQKTLGKLMKEVVELKKKQVKI